MENEVQTNVPPIQPLLQAPPIISPSTNWSKIILFVVLGFVTVAGSLFIGIQIGKKQAINTSPTAVQPTISPTYSPVNTNTDTKNQVEFTGWFSIIWGDSQDGESSIVYSVSNNAQKYNVLPISDENPDLLKFNGKEVQVVGIQTEIPNTIKLISIKAANPQ